MITLQLLYFAKFRERFGLGEETLALPQAQPTVADLLALLRARGGAFAEELAPERVFRLAIDQTLAAGDAPLHDGAEVAIFPPVTGG